MCVTLRHKILAWVELDGRSWRSGSLCLGRQVGFYLPLLLFFSTENWVEGVSFFLNVPCVCLVMTSHLPIQLSSYFILTWYFHKICFRPKLTPLHLPPPPPPPHTHTPTPTPHTPDLNSPCYISFLLLFTYFPSFKADNVKFNLHAG